MEPANIQPPIAKTSSDVPAPPGLKIAGIYQDVGSRAWIGDLWDRVADLAGPGAVPITTWSLEGLSHAPAFQEAVSAAAVAVQAFPAPGLGLQPVGPGCSVPV